MKLRPHIRLPQTQSDTVTALPDTPPLKQYTSCAPLPFLEECMHVSHSLPVFN